MRNSGSASGLQSLSGGVWRASGPVFRFSGLFPVEGNTTQYARRSSRPFGYNSVKDGGESCRCLSAAREAARSAA